MRVAADDEAVRLANDSHLGLNAYVFTRDRGAGRGSPSASRPAACVVNDVLSNYATVETPFGGIKQSGFGRVHGVEALREMCTPKHLSFDRVPPPRGTPSGFPTPPRATTGCSAGCASSFPGGAWPGASETSSDGVLTLPRAKHAWLRRSPLPLGGRHR